MKMNRLSTIIVVTWLIFIFGISALDQQLNSQSDNVGAPLNDNNKITQDASSTDEVVADDNTNGNPSEIQKAVCTVTAGEVRASAEAVTTKTLKGVCGSEEMKTAFVSLETRLEAELIEIKQILQQLSQFHGLTIAEPQKNVINVPIATPAPSNINGSPIPTASVPALKLQPIEADKTQETKLKIPILKSLESKKPIEREKEVSQFNNTLLTDQDFKLFTYYWKLENMTDRVQSGLSVTVESPVFSIKGKSLQLRATFRHLHRDYLYLQLSYAHLKATNRNNIVLDMGGLFKQIKQTEHVLFRHKISILDQNNRRSSDLVSQEFNSLDMGFSIPNSALLSSPYIKNDSLLIQLILYL